MGVINKVTNKLKYIGAGLLVALFFFAPKIFSSKPSTLRLTATADIHYQAAEFDEPSGLTLSHTKDTLWSVSDNISTIFALGLDGRLKANHTIQQPTLQGLEGIASAPDGLHLFVVTEDNNAIATLDIAQQSIIAESKLVDLVGYRDMLNVVPEHFDPDLGDNKGLEGITVHPSTGNLFVLKESGLLLEISLQQQRIIQFYALDFADDYSGICFENVAKNRLWIVSDKAKKIYLFDLATADTIKSFKLKDASDDTYTSAEGVAYNADQKTLFVVTDKGRELHTYQVSYSYLRKQNDLFAGLFSRN